MFDKLNTITSTLKYHAKQIGTGILISGLGIGAYLGFTSAFGKRSKSDSRIEEINENSLISLKNENQYPLTTGRIAEALSKSTPQSFDSVGKLEELTKSKQISKLNKNDRDLENLDNLQLNYRSKSKRAIPITSEFRVNTYTTSDQWYPAITSLTDGGFVVVWMSNGQDGDMHGTYGQQYNATGNPIGTEFQVNTYTTNDQKYPAIAGLTDSGFVVIWESVDQDGDWQGIYGQRYNATDNPIGSEFLVNTYTTSQQVHPAIAGIIDGGFVVVWESWQGGVDGYGICGQRYNVIGNPIGSEFQVDTYTTYSQRYPAITGLTDGGFVVVWQSDGQDGDVYGIYGQQYNATGNPIGSEFQVNTYTTNGQSLPAIASLPDGGFVIVWNSFGQDGDGRGVYGQQYNAIGNPIGSEFRVNTYTTNTQGTSAIANLSEGGFVVVWQSYWQDGDENGVYGQQYNATGNVIGSEFQVNTYTTSWQSLSAITGLTNERFVVVWESNGQDGDSYGIYGRIFSSNITAPVTTTTTQVPTTTTQAPTTTVPTTTPMSTTTPTSLETTTLRPITTTSVISPEAGNIAIIAGSIVGAVIGIGILSTIIGLFAVKRCRKSTYQSEEELGLDDIKVISKKPTDNLKHLAQESCDINEEYVTLKLVKKKQSEIAMSSQIKDEEHKLNEYEINWEDIQLKRKLGSGFFGTVHSALWNEARVAVKQLKSCECDDKELKEFKNEANLMASLKHPNIVTFYGMGKRANGNMFVVMEYMKGGSLYDLLRVERDLPWMKRFKIAIDIAKGLSFLHRKKILHRDLRSPNVLLTRKGRSAKIADFGLTRLTTKENVADTVHQAFGNPRWMATELFEKGRQYYTAKSDIYSYGIILWELVAQEEPYAKFEDPMQVAAAIVKGKKNPIPDNCEPKYAELIKWCWNDEPKQRPTAKLAVSKLREIKTQHKSGTAEQQPTSSEQQPTSGYVNGFVTSRIPSEFGY